VEKEAKSKVRSKNNNVQHAPCLPAEIKKDGRVWAESFFFFCIGML